MNGPVQQGGRQERGGGIGNARAFDVRTGAQLWEFSSVPQPGAVGHDTWEGNSWRGRLGVNAWPFYFTMDEDLGLLYIPLASPIPGYYGGDRGGANLFGNSVVAVDIQTGEYAWHFQTIHHDLWDHDPPAPPVLFGIPRDGRTIPALGATTKSGYLYILNRETGEPIFGVEERAVPESDVPGERAFPTQPFPLKPPPLARVRYAPADLVTAADTTADHASACAELIDSIGGVYNAGPFTPWLYSAEGAPPRSTLNFPGAWQQPLGVTEQLPAGKQNTGRPGRAGAIVTATGQVFVASTDDNRFRALEATTGRELWVSTLERRGNANPITYLDRDGTQYVAVTATDTLVVYALP